MTIIFADTKQVNAVDENNSDGFYQVIVVKLTGESGDGYRFIATTYEQVPQDGVTPTTTNEYLLPIQVDNNSSNFYKNALGLPAWALAQGVKVTEDMARRFAYKWIESQ